MADRSQFINYSRYCVDATNAGPFNFEAGITQDFCFDLETSGTIAAVTFFDGNGNVITPTQPDPVGQPNTWCASLTYPLAGTYNPTIEVQLTETNPDGTPQTSTFTGPGFQITVQ